MKTSVFLFAALLFCAHSFSQTADKEAIKKVSLAETQAYHNLDFDTWSSYHVQSGDEQLLLEQS